VNLRGDGTISLPAGNPPRVFLDEARSHGVKVCVLAWSNSRSESDSYLASNANKTIDALLAYVKANDLDGVNFDDETIRETNSLTGAPNQPLVNAFFERLYGTFKSARWDYHISYAAPPVISKADRFAQSWLDWPTIARNTDAIIPMLYTANPPSIGWATGAQPLAGGRGADGVVARDVGTLMSDYYAAAPQERAKLLLGVNSFPWPGYEFLRCRSQERLSTTIERGQTRPYDYLEAQAARYGRRWDFKQQAAWYVYRQGEEFIQGWYDDDHSWAAKLDYVNQEQLGGAGIWVVDGLNDSPAMWNMLRAAFSAPKNKIADEA
jgi:spore germination protein YaaH